MQFGIPAALWLLGLALLPLLALRRRPAARLPVATMQLWASAAAREAAPLARRVRRHWLAMLQAAIVAAIGLAVAQPLWPWRSGVAAVVVDTSLSMSARSGGASRLSLAAARATAWASELPRGTRVRLITTSPSPRQAGEFPARGGELARALAALQATGAGAGLDAALGFARAASPPPRHLLVVTDSAAPPGEIGAEWAAVGTPADNLALVSLTARRVRADAIDADVLAHVWNFGTRPATTTLTLSRDGSVLAGQALTIAPRAGATLTAVLRGGGGVVTGRIDAGADAEDAIAGDNARATDVAPPLAIRVNAGGAGGFLEQALRTRPGVTVVAGPVPDADVVVCAGCAAASLAAPPGAGVLVVPPPGARPAAAAPLSADATAAALRTSPTLDGVEAAAIDGPEPAPGAVVARAGRRPAIVAYETGGRRVVELRLDLTRSPLVLSPAFPILIADALDWLAGRDVEAATDSVTRAESDVSRAPASAATAEAITQRGGAVSAGTVSTADLSPYILLAALALIALEWWWRPGGWRSSRGVATALLAIAVLGLHVPWGEASRAIVFALDTSDSMASRRAGALSAVARGTTAMRRGDRAGLVVFGADATVERPLDTSPLGGASPAARARYRDESRTCHSNGPRGAAGRRQRARGARLGRPRNGRRRASGSAGGTGGWYSGGRRGTAGHGRRRGHARRGHPPHGAARGAARRALRRHRYGGRRAGRYGHGRVRRGGGGPRTAGRRAAAGRRRYGGAAGAFRATGTLRVPGLRRSAGDDRRRGRRRGRRGGGRARRTAPSQHLGRRCAGGGTGRLSRCVGLASRSAAHDERPRAFRRGRARRRGPVAP
jgi:hypothetical protein